MTDHRMSAPALDRETASKLNPFIGSWPSETIERCRGSVLELGYISTAATQGGYEAAQPCLFRFFEAVAAALEYEQGLLKQAEGVAHSNPEGGAQ